jgi:hypothetical protein
MKSYKPVIVVLASLGAGLIAAPAFAASVVGVGTLNIEGKCFDVPNSNVANGTGIDIWSCNGGTNQEWIVGSDRTVRPIIDTNKCLDLPNSQTANGTRVELWDCNGGANQQWTLNANGQLTGLGGKCVDDPAGNTANGTYFDYWACNGGPQTFALGPTQIAYANPYYWQGGQFGVESYGAQPGYPCQASGAGGKTVNSCTIMTGATNNNSLGSSPSYCYLTGVTGIGTDSNDSIQLFVDTHGNWEMGGQGLSSSFSATANCIPWNEMPGNNGALNGTQSFVSNYAGTTDWAWSTGAFCHVQGLAYGGQAGSDPRYQLEESGSEWMQAINNEGSGYTTDWVEGQCFEANAPDWSFPTYSFTTYQATAETGAVDMGPADSQLCVIQEIGQLGKGGAFGGRIANDGDWVLVPGTTANSWFVQAMCIAL